ncbi:bacteriocin immunity protein [Lactococcus lactis]|nr:bacteriocin immunity protein [Lactococcus lactis]
MVKKASEAEILEELYDLILSKTLNSKEREVLVKSKNDLEKGNYTRR